MNKTRTSNDSDDHTNWNRVRARRRFRALVRRVLANKYWLMDDDSTILKNLRKNVQLQSKKNKLLSFEHKVLLCQPAEVRTEEDKDTLYKIIGFLKCFRKYPGKVKRLLAGFTYFMYYGPGRTIVRQYQPAHAMYFIVSGEVEVIVTRRDELFDQDVKVAQMVLKSSDFFGDVSLLHGIPRSATVSTLTNCEFLVLFKDDFDIILKDEALQEWKGILTALGQFTYFDDWSEFDKRECCILAKIKTFDAKQTILGDGQGAKGHTHFVLSGKCAIIEHLQVHENYINGVLCRSFFTLEEEKRLKGQNKKPTRQYLSTISISGARPSSKRASISSDPKSIAKSKSGYSYAMSSTRTVKSTFLEHKSLKSKEFSLLKSKTEARFHENHERVASEILEAKFMQSETEILDFGFDLPDVETYFMKVCEFGPKACFGIGEYFQRRRIVALTSVTCLIIPKWWLIKGANLWNRIIQYLDLRVPTSEEVYKEFIRGRSYRQYKKKLLEGVYKRPTWNCTENIPLSIRCKEPPF